MINRRLEECLKRYDKQGIIKVILAPVTVVLVIIILLIGAVVLYRYERVLFENSNMSISGYNNDSLLIGAVVLYRYERVLFENSNMSISGYNNDSCCSCIEPIGELRPYMKYLVLIIFFCFLLVMFIVFYFRFGRLKKGEIA